MFNKVGRVQATPAKHPMRTLANLAAQLVETELCCVVMPGVMPVHGRPWPIAAADILPVQKVLDYVERLGPAPRRRQIARHYPAARTVCLPVQMNEGVPPLSRHLRVCGLSPPKAATT